MNATQISRSTPVAGHDPAPTPDDIVVHQLRSAYRAADTSPDGTNATGTDDDSASIRRLRDALVERAAADGLLDVAYRTVDSPLGALLLAATPAGLVRVAFEREDHDAVLSRLATSVSPRILQAPHRLDDVARQLDEYFDRRRTAFDLPVDLRLARGFRREVLEHLRDIPYGRTETYAALAGAAGRPAAVRAAASACSRNPLPLVLPCHRVVRSDGSVGQYLGGVEAKRALLNLETAA